MAPPNTNKYVTDEIESITTYNLLPTIAQAHIGPFIIIYSCWFYMWVFKFGIDEFYEPGLIALAAIGVLHILICLFSVWFVSVRCFLTCSKCPNPYNASLVKIVPTPNNGFTELVCLQRDYDNNADKPLLWFMFQKMKYVYDNSEKKRFQPINFPIDHTFKHYVACKGYQEEELKTAEKMYGKNDLNLDIPQFMELFKERATAPFFVFQVFCVGLWCLDDYWYYSLFTLVMLVVFEATLVQKQLSNLKQIRSMGSKPYFIQCYRNRKWRPVLSDELLPGDMVNILRSNDGKLIPCDLLLVRGSSIVDESMLTGESVPVMKEPIENSDPDMVLDMEVHEKLHVLSGGTKVVQINPPGKTSPGIKDNGCVGYVLRNSFSTSQGKLLRTILYGVKSVTANNFETFLFIMFLLIFAIIASSYVWIEGTKNPDRNRYKLFLECTLILTSVVPPELPIELSLAVNTSLLALSKLYIFCTEPFRIPFAGKVDITCFDKTGTLTSDHLIVEGVAGLSNKDDITSVHECPPETLQVLATCQSLTQLEDDLVGDPLEKATLKAIEWNITKGDAVVPRKGKSHGFKIYHRHHFSSTLKRMAVIAGHTPLGSSETIYIASVKGAPEILKTMYSSVPENYDEVYLSMARRGARVLALGYKKLGNLSHQGVRDLARDDVEKDLIFVGFVVISCPLKLDSKSVVKEIQNSSHHVVMITGDNPLTACHVARELHITQKTHTLSMTPANQFYSEWHWQSIDDSVNIPVGNCSNYKEIISKYDICLSGEGLNFLHMHDSKLFFKIIPHVRVHARVTPKQKEFVITTLKSLGYVTLMCGDGTNDVGALKHADAGVALLANAPERLSSKHHSKNDKNTASSSNGDMYHEKSNSHKLPKSNKIKSNSKSDVVNKSTETQKKLAALLKEMEEEEDKALVVQLGDASIAAPFTSKLSTPLCVCHIIKQGRCTLVTTLQMFKILALNALVLAYSQSVLYLDGIKFSDAQATMQGLLLAACFFFISASKPLKTLSKTRPLPNIFNVYTILTVLSQFAIHFMSLVYLKTEAQNRSPKKEEGFVNLEKEFAPSILNSTVYIISMGMQICTFAVNYKGHPFMESLQENKKLLYSLLFAGGTVVGLASGIIPELATQFEIIEFDPEMRNIILAVLAMDLIGTLIVDRTLQFLFGNSKLRKL